MILKLSRWIELASLFTCVVFFAIPCFSEDMSARRTKNVVWKDSGGLVVDAGARFLQRKDGTPFLWLGCTAWGMTEWLSREDVNVYLDDRRAKGMNIVQLCLFWGKREDYPTRFFVNPENQYGHKAFIEENGIPNPLLPAVVQGGTPDNPNDYWDHVDYCLRAIRQRGMYAAVLPLWGRRYVNAVHKEQSAQIFTIANSKQYGEFLGKRYRGQPNIIWISGGDVNPEKGGSFIDTYRLLAEGILKGITGKDIKWNEKSPAWDAFLMSYHPDGAPLVNSSEWFHNDPWLDFNMIETYVHRGKIIAAIRKDLNRKPPKPTVLGEGQYEGTINSKTANAIEIRRQAYQTFFSGGAGYTYGGSFDKQGNGPLFSLSNNWKPLLEMEGAGQIIHLRKILTENEWWNWQPVFGIISKSKGKGELEKLMVKSGDKYLLYFPDNSVCKVKLDKIGTIQWVNPQNGWLQSGNIQENGKYSPPTDWEDAVLIITRM